jgi:hypothetical protein
VCVMGGRRYAGKVEWADINTIGYAQLSMSVSRISPITAVDSWPWSSASIRQM